MREKNAASPKQVSNLPLSEVGLTAMSFQSITLALGLVVLAALGCRQDAAAEAVTREAPPSQPLTFADLEGLEISAKTVREQVVRREGRQFPVRVHADWNVIIGAQGSITQTYVSEAHTLRGIRRAKPLAGSFTLDQVREVHGLGVGQAVWRFEDATLTFLRSFKEGAYRSTITFARVPEGLTCSAAESFAREKGTGPIVLNSPIEGVQTTIISSKQVSSTCRVRKRG